jgi:hypothetical protein
MATRRNNEDPAQLGFELPEFKPRVHIPAVVVPLPGGGIQVKPGKPIVLHGEDEVDIQEAAEILGLSPRRVREMCDQGRFLEGAEWRQPGGEGGKIFIRREAVWRQSGRLTTEGTESTEKGAR